MKSTGFASFNFLTTLMISISAVGFSAGSALAGPLVSAGGMEQLLASCNTSKLNITVINHAGKLVANVHRLTNDGNGTELLSSYVAVVHNSHTTELEFAATDESQAPFDLVIQLPADENGVFHAVMTSQLADAPASAHQVTCSYAQAPLN